MDLFRKNVIIALDIQAITKPKLRILWRAYLYSANIQKQGCVNFVTAYWYVSFKKYHDLPFKLKDHVNKKTQEINKQREKNMLCVRYQLLKQGNLLNEK